MYRYRYSDADAPFDDVDEADIDVDHLNEEYRRIMAERTQSSENHSTSSRVRAAESVASRDNHFAASSGPAVESTTSHESLSAARQEPVWPQPATPRRASPQPASPRPATPQTNTQTNTQWWMAILSTVAVFIALLLFAFSTSEIVKRGSEFASLEHRVKELEFHARVHTPVDLAQRGLGAQIVKSGTSEPNLGWRRVPYRALKLLAPGLVEYDASELLAPTPSTCWPIASQATIEIELGLASQVKYVQVGTMHRSRIVVSALVHGEYVDVGFATTSPSNVRRVILDDPWQLRDLSRFRILITSEGVNDCIKYLRIMSVGTRL